MLCLRETAYTVLLWFKAKKKKANGLYFMDSHWAVLSVARGLTKRRYGRELLSPYRSPFYHVCSVSLPPSHHQYHLYATGFHCNNFLLLRRLWTRSAWACRWLTRLQRWAGQTKWFWSQLCNKQTRRWLSISTQLHDHRTFDMVDVWTRRNTKTGGYRSVAASWSPQ